MSSKWYEQSVQMGSKAFIDGETGDTNPFPSNSKVGATNRRSGWYKGYYEKRYDLFIEQLEANRTW